MSRPRITVLARCNIMYNAILDDMNGVSPNKKPRSEHRKKTREELWHDIRLQLYPDWEHMTEEEKETVESNFEINYYVVLGASKTIPSTVTSSSQGNDDVSSSPIAYTGPNGLNFQSLYTSPVMYNPRRMYNDSPMYRAPATFNNQVDSRSSFNNSRYLGYLGSISQTRNCDYASTSYREYTTTGYVTGDGESSGSSSFTQASNYGWAALAQRSNGTRDGKLNGCNWPSTSTRPNGSNEIGYGGYNTSGSSHVASNSNGVASYSSYLSDWSYGTNAMNRGNVVGPLDLRPSRKRALDYYDFHPLPPFATFQRDVRTPQPSTSYYGQYAAPLMSRSPLMITINSDDNNNIAGEIDPFQVAIEQSLKY